MTDSANCRASTAPRSCRRAAPAGKHATPSPRWLPELHLYGFRELMFVVFVLSILQRPLNVTFLIHFHPLFRSSIPPSLPPSLSLWEGGDSFFCLLFCFIPPSSPSWWSCSETSFHDDAVIYRRRLRNQTVLKVLSLNLCMTSPCGRGFRTTAYCPLVAGLVNMLGFGAATWKCFHVFRVN